MHVHRLRLAAIDHARKLEAIRPGFISRWLVRLSVLLMLTLISCGGTQRPWDEQAHIGINSSTHILRDADIAVTTLYRSEAIRVHDIEALNAVDSRYQPALVAERLALASLLAAESAVDTARATGRTEDKCLVRLLILRARTHTDDAIRLARALGAVVSEETVSALHLLESTANTFAPVCSSTASEAP